MPVVRLNLPTRTGPHNIKIQLLYSGDDICKGISSSSYQCFDKLAAIAFSNFIAVILDVRSGQPTHYTIQK